MKDSMDDAYDVIVIGGGPAGLMAALAAQTQGARTLLVEKGDKLGRKLAISGGGRCNVTNAKPLDEFLQNVPGNGRFLYSALHRFSNYDVMAFFENLGIRLKEEDRGRVFPVSDRAQTVVDALVDDLERHGVRIWLKTAVHKLIASAGTIRGVRLQNGNTVAATAVVIATGGASVPKTGSTGDAYPWAKAMGHTIVDPYPTAVPLTSDEPWIRKRVLQGLSLRNVDVTIVDGAGKVRGRENGDLLFTHFGLSGPAALRCSHTVSTCRQTEPEASLRAEIDCLPSMSAGELTEWLEQVRQQAPRKQLHNVLEQRLPDRLAALVSEKANLKPSITLSGVTNLALATLVTIIKAFPIQITGTLPLAQATVTGGGVSIKELDPRTMKSKLCNGLYFCGEVMDVHAHTGGYNITVAFSTGHLAGENAAAHALEQDRSSR